MDADVTPPRDVETLLARANELAGFRVSELAARIDEAVPEDLKHHKGWVGTLIEKCLGAHAGNQPLPDFLHIGIELKTLPVDRTGKPFESTYVAMVPLKDVEEVAWEESSVFKKLARVLWVPILSERDIAISDRMIGTSVLWSPDDTEMATLRSDWELHVETIREGFVDAISGRDGEVLQIRPKAADASKKTWTVNEYGDSVMTKPRGFYLRPSFTAAILERACRG